MAGGYVADAPKKVSRISIMIARWWFQIFFIFIPTWGRFQFWLIFFRWVKTTNQIMIVFDMFSSLRFKVIGWWSLISQHLPRNKYILKTSSSRFIGVEWTYLGVTYWEIIWTYLLTNWNDLIQHKPFKGPCSIACYIRCIALRNHSHGFLSVASNPTKITFVCLLHMYLNPPRLWNWSPKKPLKTRPFGTELWHPNGGSTWRIIPGLVSVQ